MLAGSLAYHFLRQIASTPKRRYGAAISVNTSHVQVLEDRVLLDGEGGGEGEGSGTGTGTYQPATGNVDVQFAGSPASYNTTFMGALESTTEDTITLGSPVLFDITGEVSGPATLRITRPNGTSYELYLPGGSFTEYFTGVTGTADSMQLKAELFDFLTGSPIGSDSETETVSSLNFDLDSVLGPIQGIADEFVVTVAEAAAGAIADQLRSHVPQWAQEMYLLDPEYSSIQGYTGILNGRINAVEDILETKFIAVGTYGFMEALSNTGIRYTFRLGAHYPLATTLSAQLGALPSALADAIQGRPASEFLTFVPSLPSEWEISSIGDLLKAIHATNSISDIENIIKRTEARASLSVAQQWSPNLIAAIETTATGISTEGVAKAKVAAGLLFDTTVGGARWWGSLSAGYEHIFNPNTELHQKKHKGEVFLLFGVE